MFLVGSIHELTKEAHRKFSPSSDNIVVSCAADGQVLWHDLTNPGAERMLASFTGMANMFVFHDENTILATNFRRHFTSMGGSVEGIDVRSNSSSFVLLDSAEAQVKALAMCPWDPNVVAVGVGEDVWFCDARMRGDPEALRNNNSPPCLLERMTLSGVRDIETKCRRAIGTFLPYHGREPDFQGSQLSKTYAALTRKKPTRAEEISISSIEFSRSSSREYLVSYQGDGVYRFRCSPMSSFGEGSLESRPVQFFAGHVNEMTFLKRASFFGPDEEYICCGGDDGNVFIYSSETGELVSCKKGDGFGARRGMGDGIVNGVVPHPYANSFVSYGLDSDAKLWSVKDEVRSGGGQEEEKTTQEDLAALRDEKRLKLLAYTASALKQNELLLAQPSLAPFSMMSTMIRCTRMREMCVKEIAEISEPLPSSSLVLAAFDDGAKASQVLEEMIDDPYAPARFEYCVQKTEEIREKGNVAFHDNKFREALELYSIAVQYCLGACFLRQEMLEVFESTDPDKVKALEELTEITSRSAFEIDFPASNFTKRKQEAPGIETLRRIVDAFKQVWGLFLISNLNAAQAALKLKSYKLGLSFADQAIEIDPSSSKAGFRKASALKGLGRLADALKEFKRVRTLPEGDSQLVRNCIRELVDRTAKESGAKSAKAPKTQEASSSKESSDSEDS